LNCHYFPHHLIHIKGAIVDAIYRTYEDGIEALTISATSWSTATIKAERIDGKYAMVASLL
jgi:hypothetical protein